MIFRFIIFICFIAVFVHSETGIKFTDPIGSKTGWIFEGKLSENASTVHITPQIRAVPVEGISKSMSICGYTVHHGGIQSFPFVVLLKDKKWGYAEIKLKANVDVNNLNSIYKFQLEAYDCDPIPNFSERKFVFVEVRVTKKPIFTRSSYHFTVKVNTPVGTEVGMVTAFERPGKSGPESYTEGICQYEIVSESPVPFQISEYGVLSTKALVLDYVQSKRYTFAVQASDCSKPTPLISVVPVMVDVIGDCKPHWTSLVHSLDYDGDKGVVPIVMANQEAPTLHLCSDQCQNMLLLINVTLQGPGIRPASADLCKHDEDSLTRQARLCDISKEALDMLKLAPESMRDRDRGGYFFPGNRPVTVDPTFDHVLPRKFTVMFWMRHAQMEVKGFKEQILCNTDGQVHNRHHFSLFLHNCKLILLLRKEYELGNGEQDEPSEWRYGPLREACDGRWHHFAVTFNAGAVFVQIDGEMVTQAPQQLNDRPLQNFPKEKRDTVFTVGACYHAKTDLFVQYFKGHLAAVKLIRGSQEAVNNVRCIATCGEALLLPHIVDVIGIDSSVSMFSDYVVLRSHDIFNILKMFSELSYINTEISEELQGSQVATRTVAVEATVNCDDHHISSAPPRAIVINLRNSGKSKAPKMESHIRVSTKTVVQGYEGDRVALFPNIQFIKENGSMSSLKSCIIHPVGPAIQSWEYVDWPIDMAINLHLTGLNNTHGLVIEGRQVFLVYEMILSRMYYVTSKPTQRKFAIWCSIIDRKVTEEVVVTVDVRRNDLKTYYIVDDPTQTKEDRAEVLHQGGRGGRNGFDEKEDAIHKTEKRRSVLWVILPCLLIVVVAAVVGVVLYKKRISVRRSLGLKPVPSEDRDDKMGTRMTIIRNAMASEEVMDTNDNDMCEDDVPGSETEGEEGEEYQEESVCVSGKDRIMIPTFLRLPQGPHVRSVDV